MTNLNRFDHWNNEETAKPEACQVCEAMLPDAVDGLLSEAEQKLFDRHVAGCTACAVELEEAQRGAAWLGMLKGHTPEPSAALLSRILAETTGVGAVAATLGAVQTPPFRDEAAEGWGTQQAAVLQTPLMRDKAAHEWATRNIVAMQPKAASTSGKLLAFRRKVVEAFTIDYARSTFQPRFAMTAAMAFFSVALTMNMTGFKLGDVRASGLRPSSLRRSVADASASAVRSFQNMRVVYQVESRLEDLRDDGRDEERAHSATPYAAPAVQEQPAQGNKNGKDSNDKNKDSNDGQKQGAVPQGSSELQPPVAHDDVPMREGM